jgi:hypothetical protein
VRELILPLLRESSFTLPAQDKLPRYLERGSTDYLGRGTEKSCACAIASDLLEQNILVKRKIRRSNQGRRGMEGNNMTQIRSIRLGLMAICIATVPLSLAQTPRTGTSGSNKTAATIGTAAGHSGLSGNFPSGVQAGTNFRSSTSTGPNPNAGAHIGINAGAQIGISNQMGGITGGAAGGLGSSSGNSTGTTQIGANARTGTNSTANTNAGAHTAAAAATSATINTIRPQLAPVPIRSPLPNNSPSGSNFSTAGQSPSPLPSASVTPTPTLTPAQLL